MPGPSLHGEFTTQALLDTVVPHAADLDIEAALTSALESGAEGFSSVLDSIPQRSLLFFDETVPVRVVLRLSNCSEQTLKEYLPRLDVRLEACVLNPADTESPKDIIFAGAISAEEDPLVVVNVFEGEKGSGNHVYVVWKISAFLNRPRVRIQSPCVVFTASATLRPRTRSDLPPHADDYLPSLVPAASNVLEALSSDPQLSSTDLHLPASRLLRVVPAALTEDPTYSIGQQSQHPIRIVPVAGARIRCTRLNTFSNTPATIVSLELEATPFQNSDVVFDRIDLKAFDGHIESLSNVPELQPPLSLRPRDDVALVYKLSPDYGADPTVSTTSQASVLDISLEAVVKVSDDCQPRIAMAWRTSVDLPQPVNPFLGGPSEASQRTSRPTSLPVSPTQNGDPSGPSSVSSSSSQAGLTISFSGPATVEVSKPFRWNVFIVNRSASARKFAMVAIPRRKRTDPRRHVARPSSSSASNKKEEQLAEAVTDETIVHAMQKSVAGQDADLVPLSSDVRIGPLLPGTCHSTELVLLPLSAGPLQLEVVRLVDLNSNETVDIRTLPDIMAIDRRKVDVNP